MALLTCALNTAGCVTSVGRSQDSAARTSSRPPAALTVLEWAVLGPRISAVIRNDGTSTVTGRAVLTARDSRGTVVAAASAPGESACCLLAHLAPGAQTAIFVDVGTAARRTASVRVASAEVTPRSPTAVRARATATDVAVQTGSTGSTAVRADVTVDVAAALVVRVVLADAEHHLVTVLGGRVACAQRAVATPVSLELADALPPGTVVRTLLVSAVASC